jgi:hypothetical protein
MLLGGNPLAGPASFDLPQSVRNLNPKSLPVAQVGAASAIASVAELAPWSERHSALLLGLLVAAVVAMLALVFSSMRKMPGAQG